MDFYFLLFSLFFPRIVLLVYFLLQGHFPQSTIPIYWRRVVGDLHSANSNLDLYLSKYGI